ncbi:MAG TPA: saccharopine dehydrogenase NADP-binding domain-containing protein [Solirubrobacteraceae bacterium]|nr:saccharopine dehydrogenase NADP-binding domain-containing protein [Solirubrobacteraceae bacterium]
MAGELDVVVFGAGGVTGRNVAAYLASRATEGSLKWAAAGRDPHKVQGVLGQLGVRPPEILTADVSAPESLVAMASRARVVLDLVGPYTRYGRPVIDACLDGGAHYADLTGELPFVRGIIDAHHERATRAGLKLVQVCGFESLPADLLVAELAELAAAESGDGLASVDLDVTVTAPPGRPYASDMVSGGTFQSIAALTGADDAALALDPAVLIPENAAAAAVRTRSPITLAPRRGADGVVIAPMAPAPFINPGVIHRSAFLRAQARGDTFEPFRYREGIAIGGRTVTLPARWLAGAAMGATMSALGAVARSGPAVRRPVAGAMAKLGPGSGFGPTGARLERWRWRMTATALTRSGRELHATLDADGHPGYLATARLLGEAGILLAEDGATPAVGGCLTPAAALGTECLERFARAGLRFSSPRGASSRP